MSEPKNLDRWMPKELALNQPMTLEMHPDAVKQLENHEKEMIGRIRELENSYRELLNKHAEADKKLRSVDSAIYFRDQLSINCLTHHRTMTIIACAESKKNSRCRGCKERDNILEKLRGAT